MSLSRFFKQILCSRRMLVILLLGFSSGLPLALVGDSLKLWFASDGMSITAIGFLSLVGQPYVYKFLWSPILDRFRFPLFGRRRGWMIAMQLALIVAIAAMSFQSPKNHPYLVAFLALVIASFSATQDIAVDAYRTDILTEKDRAMGASTFTAAYRIAMLVSGAVAVKMAGHLGWHVTYLAMAACMGVGLFASCIALEPCDDSKVPHSFKEMVVDPFKDFLTKPAAILILFFIIFYKLGDAFVGNLTTTFLYDVGFSLDDIGNIYKVVSFIATLVGVFIGGVVVTRQGLFKGLLLFGVLQAVTNLFFIPLIYVKHSYSLLCVAVFAENAFAGMGTAAFLTLLMSLCSHRYTATQFALLSALSAVGRVFIGPVAGIVASQYGWAVMFALSVVIAAPGVIMLLFLTDTIHHAAQSTLTESA